MYTVFKLLGQCNSTTGQETGFLPLAKAECLDWQFYPLFFFDFQGVLDIINISNRMSEIIKFFGGDMVH